jgi:hypothetical protein
MVPDPCFLALVWRASATSACTQSARPNHAALHIIRQCCAIPLETQNVAQCHKIAN